MNDTNPTTENREHDLHQVVGELSALADAVKLKVHLGSMEAKDAWRRLEPQVDDLRARARSAKGQLLRELDSAAKDVKAELQDLGTLLGIEKR